MAKQDSFTEIIPISGFRQGSPLPYEILNNQFINAAYPNENLEIRKGGFGSDAAAHPTHPNRFYALTDRGPNADYEGSAGSGKQFLIPDYTPCIGLFELQADSKIVKIKEILLKDSQGNPISGLPNPKAFGGTDEIPYDLDGQPMTVNPELPFDEIINPIKTDINGLDPEGLAALDDGSFWISDEYGPHLVHYNADGVEIERINPFANDERNNIVVDNQTVLLPPDFAKRHPNKGMESLTITPDQTTLVGVMESSLDNPNNSVRRSSLVRLVTINLVSGQVAQYLYRLNDPQHVTSGIAALNSYEFYIIEHDRKFPLQDKFAQKHIYKIDFTEATDITTITAKSDAKQDVVRQDKALGLIINNQTLEQFIAADESNWLTLDERGIKSVNKTLVVDVIGALDYPHDKLEGLWLRQDGSLGLLNDDDFAMTDSETQDLTADHSKSSVEQKYLDREKTIEDATRLYIVIPSE